MVANWRAVRGERLDDLSALAAFVDAPDRLADVLGNRQRVPGNYTTKAEAAARAAAGLADADIPCAARIGDGRTAWDAITAVPGLGTTTWETFVLQLGPLGPAALDVVRGFVAEAGGDSGVTDTTALELLGEAAAALDVDSAALTNAVWRSGRIRRRASNPLSA